MTKYKNLGGKSTVAAYELAKDYITVRFTTSAVLRFSNQITGAGNVRQMKSLAVAGKGLGTFITSKVENQFARKIR